MEEIEKPPQPEPPAEPIPFQDHPIRSPDRYGPDARWLRRWSLDAEGLPVCTLDALDTATATAEEIEAAEEGNAAVRAALLDVPDPASALPPPTLADYEVAIQAHVDATAGQRGYSSGVSCASYAASTVPAFAAEAAAFIAWRDAVWIAVHTRLAEVQGGAAAPTVRGLVADLPAMVWPA